MVVADFFAALVDANLKKNSLSAYRCTLRNVVSASVRDFMNSTLIDSLIAAAGKKNPRLPSIPKTNKVWNIDQVLEYLRSLPPYLKLSPMKLAQKTLVLIWLATGRRRINIHRLSINSMVKDAEKYNFLLTTLSKNFNEESYRQCQFFEIQRFRDPAICPYTALEFYLRRTKHIRTTPQVFIITTGTTAASSCTLARWATKTLKEAGIDISLFKPHSIRSAASSAAYQKHIPLDKILEMGKWAVPHTFMKHYCRGVEHFDSATRGLQRRTVPIHDSHVFAHTNRTAGNIIQKYSAQKKRRAMSVHSSSKSCKRRKLTHQRSDANPPRWTNLPPLPLTAKNLQLHNAIPQTAADQASETDLFQHVDSVSEYQAPSSHDQSSMPPSHRRCSPPKKVYSKHHKRNLPPVYNPRSASWPSHPQIAVEQDPGERVPPPRLNTALLDLLGIKPSTPSTSGPPPCPPDSELRFPMAGLLTNISPDSSPRKPLPQFSEEDFSPPSSPEFEFSSGCDPEPGIAKSEEVTMLPSHGSSQLSPHNFANVSGTPAPVALPPTSSVVSDLPQTSISVPQQPPLLPKPIIPIIGGTQRPIIQTTSSPLVSLIPVKMPKLPSKQPNTMTLSAEPSSPVLPIPSVQMIDTINLPPDQIKSPSSLAKATPPMPRGAPAGAPSARKPYITESLDQPQPKHLKNINHQMPGLGEISEMELRKLSGKYRRTHSGLKTSWPLHVLDFSKKELGIYNNARYHMLPIRKKDSDSYVKNGYPCSTLPDGRVCVLLSTTQMHSVAATRVKWGIILRNHGSTSVDS